MADLTARFRGARSDAGRVVLEGFHAIKHALRFGAELHASAARDDVDVDALAESLAPDLRARLTQDLIPVPAAVFDQLAPAPHPTGLIAIAARPAHDLATLLVPGDAPLVFLDAPSGLGNIGAAVRVAAAAGAAGVLSSGMHDPWNPESVRGAAGLHFALPVARVDALPELPRPLVALDPEGEVLTRETPLSGCVLAFGPERAGLDPGLLARADRRIAIPMASGVSSLNLATAVAVALYTWRLAAGPA